MAQLTRPQLIAQLEAERHNNEQLKLAVARLEGEVAALKAAKPAKAQANVFTFDPAIKGDFIRASKLAREQGGIVRRIGA